MRGAMCADGRRKQQAGAHLVLAALQCPPLKGGEDEARRRQHRPDADPAARPVQSHLLLIGKGVGASETGYAWTRRRPGSGRV
ncbi:hypothetical protein ACVWZD_008851 [Streptomyces sp. TE3672]